MANQSKAPRVSRSYGGGKPHSRYACDPFNQGLDKKVVMRLLSGKFTKPDLEKYHKTDWFSSLRDFCIEYYKSCVMCGGEKSLQLHHRKYRRLFDESISEDVTILCARHHSAYHRGGRR